MAQNIYTIKQFLKLEPTAGTPPSENGVIWYDSGDNKFKKIENGSTTDLSGGTISAGVAGRLGLYPTSSSTIDDVYVQNSQDIDVAIVAQPTRSAAIEYTIPNPGDAVTAADFVLTQGAQTLAGVKTFSSAAVLAGASTSANVTFATGTGIQSTSAASTLNIGTGANTTTVNIGAASSTINIGATGATVNLIGSVTEFKATQSQVDDPLITLNKGGAAASGGGSGFEIEENSSITGYVKVSAARTGFDLKAPATAGVATFVTDATSRTYTLPAATGTLLTAVVQDTAPQLGGALDVNGNAIQSVSNGNIAVAPNGTGRVRLAKQGALTRYVDMQYFDAVSLTASTTAVASSFTFDSTLIKAQEVKYTIVEATTNKRSMGTIMVVGDGASGVASSTVSIIDVGTSTSDPGVTWSAALNSNNIELSYTTTANAKTMQAVVQRFLA